MTKEEYKRMTTAEWIQAHRDIVIEDYSYMDEYIYDMSEIDEILEDYTPGEILRMVHFGKFNPTDNYFWFDAYGNLRSGSRCEWSPILEKWISDFDFTPDDIIRRWNEDE